jgi:hypothetical protein
MNYLQATTYAPSDADYIVYQENVRSWVVLRREASDGNFKIIANCDRICRGLIIKGISASGKSFWDAETQQFLCGNLEQLTRQEWDDNYFSEALPDSDAYCDYAGQGEY